MYLNKTDDGEVILPKNYRERFKSLFTLKEASLIVAIISATIKNEQEKGEFSQFRNTACSTLAKLFLYLPEEISLEFQDQMTKEFGLIFSYGDSPKNKINPNSIN